MPICKKCGSTTFSYEITSGWQILMYSDDGETLEECDTNVDGTDEGVCHDCEEPILRDE